MSTPPGPEPAGADETDDDRADTDPLPTMNMWGGSWSESNAAERTVVGDVDLPAASVPFAFPSTAPRQSRAGRNRAVLIGVGAAAVLALLGGLTVWLTSGSSDSATATDSDTVTTSTGQPPGTGRDAAAEARLMRALPPGYPPGACQPTEPTAGAVATVKCDANVDPGGPTSATFLLARDKAALDVLFAGAAPRADVVLCPGNIQSPGAWRRNANPQQVVGTLVCATRDNVATVGWTDEARLLVSVVRSNPPGPTLDQLYLWWSSHS